jgi:hypothetical protein
MGVGSVPVWVFQISAWVMQFSPGSSPWEESRLSPVSRDDSRVPGEREPGTRTRRY